MSIQELVERVQKIATSDNLDDAEARQKIIAVVEEYNDGLTFAALSDIITRLGGRGGMHVGRKNRCVRAALTILDQDPGLEALSFDERKLVRALIAVVLDKIDVGQVGRLIL
jgi:hypothetical protein